MGKEYIEENKSSTPLAEKMRARNLDEFIGQKHIVGVDSLIRRALKVNRLGSCVFYGPPGVGKTTLAFIIASSLNLEYVKLNAVSSGVGEAKKVIDKYATSSVCMFKIINIEEINEKMSGQIGNEIITEVSNIIKEKMSDEYIFVRYMGPKFTIVFSGVEEDSLEEFLKNIKEEIEELQIIDEDEEDTENTEDTSNTEVIFPKLNFVISTYYKGTGLEKLTNKLDKKNDVNISYFINPTFGNFEEKTARHILSEFMGDDNYMKLRNVYSINFGDVNVFMSSSEKIESAICDKILSKSIDTKVSLEANEEKMIAFVLGCGMSDRENLELIRKYTNVVNATKELKAVKDNWRNTLGTIEVKSDDKSFDYVVNGWYLYQALSSRIMAKAGFYQVSGAFGYRDQLQDSMNIAMIKPEITREQILTNAAHQFPEGDVLHWWHEKNKFGLRSRYKDDYLWLVYATIYYVEVTGDKSILYEEVPYLLGDKLSEYEHEKGITFSYSNERGTLLDHCIRSLQLSMHSLGKHKLPLMGGGDWNDGMNKVGIKGKGESVWLGFFLYEIISDFVKMMKNIVLIGLT